MRAKAQQADQPTCAAKPTARAASTPRRRMRGSTASLRGCSTPGRRRPRPPGAADRLLRQRHRARRHRTRALHRRRRLEDHHRRHDGQVRHHRHRLRRHERQRHDLRRRHAALDGRLHRGGEDRRRHARRGREGLCKGAEPAQISISGGETAQLKDVVKRFDIVGMAVGRVARPGHRRPRRARRRRRHRRKSSGIHSNGLSLARKAFFGDATTASATSSTSYPSRSARSSCGRPTSTCARRWRSWPRCPACKR